jgi:hypothetical protein
MRVGRITSTEIIARADSSGRWGVNGKYDLKEAYEGAAGNIVLADVLNGRSLNDILGRTETDAADLEHAAEIVFVALDPSILGMKVFRLCLADIAETFLADFETSEWNSPEPRAMVDAIRALAFGETTPVDVKAKAEAAYTGENSRADVYFYGYMATEPPGSKKMIEGQCLIFAKLQKTKTLAQAQAIIDRMKEYDVGTVNLAVL